MKALPIRTRLMVGYLAVLATATLVLAGGAWWLFHESVIRAADDSLAARIQGTRRFIFNTEHELPREELSDEFKEFADLTRGEVLLEVSDEHGRTLCLPALPGWEQLRVDPSPEGSLRVSPRVVLGDPYRAVATELVVEGHHYRLWAATSMARAFGALRQFGWLLAGLVPIVLVLAAAGGFWLSGRALAPVDKITRDVQSISLPQLDRRLELPAADDELRRLAVTFNGMLARLQAAVAEIVRFTADASHELRTPVSLMRTTAEVTLGKERSAEEYREALTDLSGHVGRMSLLVDNLLTLARSDAGVEQAATTRVDAPTLVTETCAVLRPMFDNSGLSLVVSSAPDPASVQGHGESLRRLLFILLDNAMRYTPRGGRVNVRQFVESATSGHGPSAVIEISDSGIGLGPADRERAFDRFYRGETARSMALDGAGLGLSIARTIVDRHHGEIALLPGDEGRGCCVRISLPVAVS